MFLMNSFDHNGIEPLSRIIVEFGPFKIFGYEIGPITIMWYAVLILSGAMVALLLGIKEGKRIGVSKDFLEDLVLLGIPISVIGARLYYVLFQWDYYKDNLIDILKIYEGGLAIHGAVFFAVIWGFYLCGKRGVNFLKAVDLGAVGFLIAQAIGRWGNFMNQEAHGGFVPGNTLDAQRAYLQGIGLPNFIVNQMYINDEFGLGYYHPTFLYESLWNILGFILMLILRKTKILYLGDLGLIYLMWYSVGRFYIEGMRTDSLYVWNTGLRTAQIISIILFTIGLTVFILRRINQWYPKYYYEVVEENL